MSHNVFDRLEKLENAVFGRAAVGSGALPDRKLSTTQVALRAGVSMRTIQRGIESHAHPPPDETVNGRNYWWLSTLERHERERSQSTTRAPANAGKPAIRRAKPRRRRAQASPEL
jgi:hypothetical protein